MARKRCHRKVIVPALPRGLRPKLSRDQLRDLSLAHLVNLDAVASGTASKSILWDLVEQMLTWSRVAELLGAGTHEMNDQMAIAARLIDRFKRTGKILFNGPDYQVAKQGIEIMDALASAVDLEVAIAATTWSRAEVLRVAAAMQAEAGEIAHA